MADSVEPVPGNSPQGAEATQQAGSPQAGSEETSGLGYDDNTRIRTMLELQEVAPGLHKSMMRSLMSNMINQMNRFRRNIKRAMNVYQQ